MFPSCRVADGYRRAPQRLWRSRGCHTSFSSRKCTSYQQAESGGSFSWDSAWLGFVQLGTATALTLLQGQTQPSTRTWGDGSSPFVRLLVFAEREGRSGNPKLNSRSVCYPLSPVLLVCSLTTESNSQSYHQPDKRDTQQQLSVSQCYVSLHRRCRQRLLMLRCSAASAGPFTAQRDLTRHDRSANNALRGDIHTCTYRYTFTHKKSVLHLHQQACASSLCWLHSATRFTLPEETDLRALQS